MTKDDVIRIAREAGVHHINLDDDYIFALERFAALVREAERKACAQICNDRLSYPAELVIRSRGDA